MRPTGIIAQRIHLGAVGTDLMKQIRQRDISAVILDQRCLSVLAGSTALRTPQPHHCGGVFG